MTWRKWLFLTGVFWLNPGALWFAYVGSLAEDGSHCHFYMGIIDGGVFGVQRKAIDSFKDM